jgi:hypothetical protein
MGIGADVFDALDAQILKCVDRQDAEDLLIGFYVDLWRALKKRVGTSSNFTGMSEYLFFRYVLKRLEHRCGITFVAQECTADTCIFQSEELLLTRDVYVSKFDPIAPKQKPDIALFFRPERVAPWQLLAAFEVKIGIDRSSLNKMLLQLNELLACPEVLVFPVVFNSLNVGPQFKSELDAFCQRSKPRAFVISKRYTNNAKYEMAIGLNEAIDRALELGTKRIEKSISR